MTAFWQSLEGDSIGLLLKSSPCGCTFACELHVRVRTCSQCQLDYIALSLNGFTTVVTLVAFVTLAPMDLALTPRQSVQLRFYNTSIDYAVQLNRSLNTCSTHLLP